MSIFVQSSIGKNCLEKNGNRQKYQLSNDRLDKSKLDEKGLKKNQQEQWGQEKKSNVGRRLQQSWQSKNEFFEENQCVSRF